MSLKYPDLQYTLDDKGRFVWTYGPDKKPLYGGKVVENVTQALARCVMTDGMLRINKRYRCVLTVHDEAVSPIPEDEGEEGTAWMIAQMTQEPSYMPGIPLAAEAGYALRYGDAK
jgi:DNA polymerase